jgi:hypothetical protein
VRERVGAQSLWVGGVDSGHLLRDVHLLARQALRPNQQVVGDRRYFGMGLPARHGRGL